MGGLFRSPKAPVVRAPAPAPVPAQAQAPTRETAAEDIGVAQEEERTRRRTQRGRAATILSGRRRGAVGDDVAAGSMGGLATKQLLGG